MPKFEKVAGISIECICDDGKKRIVSYRFNAPTKNVLIEQSANMTEATHRDNDTKVKVWSLPLYDIKINIECVDFDVVLAEVE